MEFKTFVVRFKKPHSKYGRIKMVNVPKEVTIEEVLEKFPDEIYINSRDLHEIKQLTNVNSQLKEFMNEFQGTSKLLDRDFRDSWINDRKIEFLKILSDFKCKELNLILARQLKSLKVLLTDEVRRELNLMIINGELRIPERVTDFEEITFDLRNGKLRKPCNSVTFKI